MEDAAKLHNHGRLREIRIEGLFGQRDIHVVLGPDYPTVLTGPNGSGKSTILRLIHAAGKLDTFELMAHGYRRLELSFSAGDSFVVEKSREMGAWLRWRGREFHLAYGESLSSLSPDVKALLAEAEYDPERALSLLTERGPRYAASYTEYRLARRTLSELDPESIKPSIPAWLNEFTKYFPVEFISDRRLQDSLDLPDRFSMASRAGQDTRAISGAAQYIGTILSQAQARYGRGTERQDLKLPEMVVAAMRSGSDPTQGEVLELVESVRARSRQLRSVGLLETREDEDDVILTDARDAPAVRQVVAAILTFTLQRLNHLAGTEHQLTAFKAFLDRRLNDKTLHLGGRRGMMFETSTGYQIRPEQLSSGEQHLVILAFDLIFGHRRDSLVIIDEPEISLHVAWQDNLLSDFIELGRGRNLSFLMASHAPSLIAFMPECEFPIGVAQ